MMAQVAKARPRGYTKHRFLPQKRIHNTSLTSCGKYKRADDNYADSLPSRCPASPDNSFFLKVTCPKCTRQCVLPEEFALPMKYKPDTDVPARTFGDSRNTV